MHYANNNINYEIKCATDAINVLVNISSSRSDRYLKFTSMHKVSRSNLQRRIHFTSTLFFVGTFSLAEKRVHISLPVFLLVPSLSLSLFFSLRIRKEENAIWIFTLFDRSLGLFPVIIRENEHFLSVAT